MDDHTPPSDNMLAITTLQDSDITDEILTLAVRELENAATAYREAGEIEANLAAKLNAQTARINAAADRLRKSLGKPAVSHA